MSNEQKVCCGGFFIGDGLEMDGKTLKALGGGSEGYSYYPVSCTYTPSTGEATISESFADMLENIKNKKIPMLYDEYDVWHLFAWDDWTLEFAYVYASNSASYVKTITYDEDGVSVNSIGFDVCFEAKFTKNGTDWSFSKLFSESVNNIVNRKGTYRISYQMASNQPFYYLDVIGYSRNSYVLYGCSYPTDTGIHFDYFKLKSDNTVEYTSKDITI